jgi:hypothetical protein
MPTAEVVILMNGPASFYSTNVYIFRGLPNSIHVKINVLPSVAIIWKEAVKEKVGGGGTAKTKSPSFASTVEMVILLVAPAPKHHNGRM